MSTHRTQVDHYGKEAKRKGYRARSVFKLEEIQDKFKIIKPNQYVLDLGAAPGSFLQYISNIVGKNGLVVGIDLQEITPLEIENVITIQQDITTITEDSILNSLGKEKEHFNTIVADLAPKTSGNKELDHYKSIELNEIVFNVAKSQLAQGGSVISKVFEGEDLPELIAEIKKDFKKVRMFKPKASQKSRNELYILAQTKS